MVISVKCFIFIQTSFCLQTPGLKMLLAFFKMHEMDLMLPTTLKPKELQKRDPALAGIVGRVNWCPVQREVRCGGVWGWLSYLAQAGVEARPRPPRRQPRWPWSAWWSCPCGALGCWRSCVHVVCSAPFRPRPPRRHTCLCLCQGPLRESARGKLLIFTCTTFEKWFRAPVCTGWLYGSP